MMLTCPPAERPNSGPKLLRSILNSSIVSTEGYIRMVRCDPVSLLLAPSTSHWFPFDGPPLMDTSEAPFSPLLVMLKASAGDTPGTNVNSCMKLRPFSGNSAT